MSNDNTAPIAQTRENLVSELISWTRGILGDGDLERAQVDQIGTRVQALAERGDLWNASDYPPPEDGQLHNRFLVGKENDEGISLYLNVMRAGKKIPPHNHTTWACIAAVEGIEHNTLYERTDDGSVEGKGTLAVREVVAIAPGQALAMMPDDIHSVEIRNDQVIRHLHFYGRPLEKLSERKAFDMDAGTYKIMQVGVKTQTSGGT